MFNFLFGFLLGPTNLLARGFSRYPQTLTFSLAGLFRGQHTCRVAKEQHHDQSGKVREASLFAIEEIRQGPLGSFEFSRVAFGFFGFFSSFFHPSFIDMGGGEVVVCGGAGAGFFLFFYRCAVRGGVVFFWLFFLHCIQCAERSGCCYGKSIGFLSDGFPSISSIHLHCSKQYDCCPSGEYCFFSTYFFFDVSLNQGRSLKRAEGAPH